MYCSKMKIKYLKCPAECVNAVNRDERAFVKHGRMQDLLRGGRNFCGLGKLRAGEAARGITTRLLRRFWGMPPPPAKIFLNGAFWSIFS